MRTERLVLRTPEGVVFALRLASPVTRLLAVMVDTACVMVLASVCGTFVNLVGVIDRDLAMALSVLSYFAISTAYPILMEWRCRGQTLGKRLFRLRVVDEEGLHLHVSQVGVRNLLRIEDMLPAFYLVGGVAALVSRHSQRLGDLAAGTVVVWEPRVAEPDLRQIMESRHNTFRDCPLQQARLRERTSMDEASLALRAVLRRDQFDPEARLRLFAELAARLRESASFPEEATVGLSDEQYVRNAVDVLFARRQAAAAAGNAGP